MSFFKKHYEKIGIEPPLCHFVLGSGFSDCVDKLKEQTGLKNWVEKAPCSFKEVPGLPSPSVRSHAGLFRFFSYKDTKKAISLQCGRIHLYEGHSAQTVVLPVMKIFLAGTKQFVLSNISGGLKLELKVGSIVPLKDHVNFTGVSPLTGPEQKTPEGKKIGHRFPDMSRIYCQTLNQQIATELGDVPIHKGVYVGVSGPELESPTYIQWLNTSSKGLFDVVGMSTVLSAIALKQAGARLGAFSVVSNPASGVHPHYKELSFSNMCQSIETPIIKLIKAYFLYSEKHLIL